MNLLPAMVSSGLAAAAGMAAWGAVVPSSELFGPTVRHTASSRKIALTFDDGPNPAVTPRLLELFERHCVRATFFLIGKFARACPELVKEISARGHLVGNHSDTHANLIFRSRAGDSRGAGAVPGRESPPPLTRNRRAGCVRPYGYRSPLLSGEIRRAGMRGVVMWSKICWDWKPQPPERLIKRLSRVAQPNLAQGDIVVLHDGDHRALGGDRHHVVTALEHWLPRWRDAGMEFVTMEPSSAGATSDAMRSPRA